MSDAVDRILEEGGPAAGMIRALLGCEWGWKITTPDDKTLCHERAVKIVCLHDEGATIEVKLCEAHKTRVLSETTPHEDMDPDHDTERHRGDIFEHGHRGP